MPCPNGVTPLKWYVARAPFSSTASTCTLSGVPTGRAHAALGVDARLGMKA